MVLRTEQNNKEILQHANDQMHWLLKQGEILLVVKHLKEDPIKFEIVADSNYDKTLEGVQLTFADPEDFKKHFPELIPIEYVKADDTIRIRENKDKEYYPVAVRSIPPVSENNIEYIPEHVLSDDIDSIWAVKKIGARLVLDYGEDIDIRTIWIAWGRGNLRQFKFTIAYGIDKEITKEKKQWHVVPHLQNVYSSGTTDQPEPYQLVKHVKEKESAESIRARYVIIQVNGNTSLQNSEWAVISRAEVSKLLSVKSSEKKERDESTIMDAVKETKLEKGTI